jgi:organic radical activating enzyme
MTKYNAWLIWILTEKCNLNCSYCFCYGASNTDAAHIGKINIPLLIKTLNKSGKVFRITLAGGEPFLISNLVDACTRITKDHYIDLYSNLTMNQITDFIEKINPNRVLMVHASAHIQELERNNLLAKHVINILHFKKKGFRISAEEVAHPSLVSCAQKYKEYFRRMGVYLKYSPFYGMYNNKRYPYSYTKNEQRIFRLNQGDFKIYNTINNRCNAGYNSGTILPDGKIRVCRGIPITIGNIYRKIKFRKNLILCRREFCFCPVNRSDPDLFKKVKFNLQK